MIENTDSRIKNSKRNVFTGLLMQGINILLPFATRTVILYVLGVQYQGLGSLFNSILQVLNLADLGFSSAVVFVLYKPISENDEEKICAIINFLRKIYFIIGIVILIIGGGITPLLPYLISGDYPSDINIYLLFLIYLSNTSLSYMFFAYKNTLLISMQRKDITNVIMLVINTVVRGTQIALLFTTKNYYFYALCLPIGTMIGNIAVHIVSVKFFPNIKPIGKMDETTKKKMKHQIGAICIDRICDVARNSFDNIVISVLMGLTLVAIYSNYFYIFTAAYGIMIVINQALSASVGNSIAKESIDKNYYDLKKITFMYMWITGFFAICMACLYQDFMMIWMDNNEDMLLPIIEMLMFALYFYLINMNNSRNLYLDGSGLHVKCKIWHISEAVLNLALNFLLGYFMGILGVLLATIITIIAFNFVARTIVLFKYYFNKKPYEFFIMHIFYFLVSCISGVSTYFVCKVMPIGGIWGFIIKIAICGIMANSILFLFYFKTPQFKKAIEIVKNMIGFRKKDVE